MHITIKNPPLPPQAVWKKIPDTLRVFSIRFEVNVGSWEVDVAEAKCQQHFA